MNCVIGRTFPIFFRLQKSGLTIEEFVLILTWWEMFAEFVAQFFEDEIVPLCGVTAQEEGYFVVQFFVTTSNRISELCGRTRRSLSCFSIGKRKVCRVFSAVFLKVRACPCGSLRCIRMGFFVVQFFMTTNKCSRSYPRFPWGCESRIALRVYFVVQIFLIIRSISS